MPETETYLGDGLYASFDGFMIRLWAPREHGVVHEVFLEPQVLFDFLNYAKRLGMITEWTR